METSGGLGFCFEGFDDRVDVGGGRKREVCQGFPIPPLIIWNDRRLDVRVWSSYRRSWTEDVTLGIVRMRMVIKVARMNGTWGESIKPTSLVKCTK